MKILLRSAIAVVIIVGGTVLMMRIAGVNPKGPRAGLWLSGTRVTVPVKDWSFVNQHPTIAVQTHTWYWIPHSVTIYCVSYQNNLYLQALGRGWTGNLARDPRVRVKVGENLYDRSVSRLTDTAELAGVVQSMETKYPKWRPTPDSPPTLENFLRVAHD